MEKKSITKFPKGFFKEKRPTIAASDALKGVAPIKWKGSSEKAKNGGMKLIKRNG